MNYSEATTIKYKINKSQRIFINCHKSPDIDSIGSALAMYNYLKTLNKEVDVYSPDNLVESLSFIQGYNKIKVQELDNELLSGYDLILILDTPDEVRFGCKLNNENISKSIIIDHHKDNTKYADINLLDFDAGSAAEVLYRLFQDFEANVSNEIGTALLAGMAGDSSAFRNQGANSQVFKYVGELMDLGVDKTSILTQIYGNISIEGMNFLGEFLKNFKISNKHPYCWNIIDRKMLEKYKDLSAIELYAGIFMRTIKHTDFGMLFIEKENGDIHFQVKARKDIDVSSIAKNLGGGGHRRAGGNTFTDSNLSKVIEMAIAEADRFYR